MNQVPSTAFRTFVLKSNEKDAISIAEESTNEGIESVHVFKIQDGSEISVWNEDGMVEVERDSECLFISYKGRIEPNE